LRSKTL